MAITRQGDALTRAHRVQQQRIRVAAVQQARSLVPLFNRSNPASTWGPWTRAMTATINQGRSLSSRAAMSYYLQFRRVEGAKGLFLPIPAEPLEEIVVAENLAKAIIPDGSKEAAYSRAVQQLRDQRAEAAALAETESMVAAAGAESIIASTESDEQATTFARVASANACAFCLMLESRGPVYQTIDAASFLPHLLCGCSPEPVMDTGTYRNDKAAESLDLYARSGGDINAMRRDIYAASDNTALNAARREEYAAVKAAEQA